MDRLQELLKNPITKELLKWKLALCQHPMYLLIDEDRGDPVVGERVPPWGAKEAADYVDRVERNLSSLDEYSDLVLNYQFSGVEIDAMAIEFPETVERMRKKYDEGKLDFIDGSFSQPHLQVVGSESNWRQFEMGLDIYSKLFGKKVTLYARQETGLHQQLPQILQKFGYTMMMVPPFPWAMEIIEGKFELTGLFRRVETVQEDEFINVVALDGSTLPIYLKVIDPEHEGTESSKILGEISKSPPNGPPIWTLFPDMVEIDEKLYMERKRLFDYVLLGPALEKRLEQAPPRAKGRIYTYWSYTEGVWAEELLRANKEAEETAVLAEGLYCQILLNGNEAARPNPFDTIWYDILKYQHHDVSWIEVTDLRRKAVNKLQGSVQQCRQIMKDFSGQLLEHNPDGTAFFNVLPWERKALLWEENSKIPGANFMQNHKGQSFGFSSIVSGGYSSYQNSNEFSHKTKLCKFDQTISTDHYTVSLTSNGLIEKLELKDNTPLLKTGSHLGGELRALIKDTWVDNRKAECKKIEGPVATVIERNSRLGKIPVVETYYFFVHEPLIKVELAIQFNGNEVGYFWLDETKINVHFPTIDSEIYHDIPFGYVEGRENRNLFAPNWVYKGGLVYVNRGTPKHCVREGVLRNTLAWGGHSFSNRLQFEWAQQHHYDLKLYGHHKLEYYLIPFGGFNGNQICRTVQDYLFPVFMSKGTGQKSFYHVQQPGLLFSSLHEREGKVWFRGLQLPHSGQNHFRDWEIIDLPLEDL